MTSIQNEKGLTLLEVLLSIVILSIILISIMKFFPQMGLMNKQNIDKQQAINTARETLFEFQNDSEVKRLIKYPASTSSKFEFIEKKEIIDSGTFNCFKLNGKIHGYIGQICLKETPDIGNAGGKELFQIHIELLNSKGTLITDTYGYIMPD